MPTINLTDKTVFICTAPSDQPKTGDVDYAQSIVSTLNAHRIESILLKDKALTGDQIVAQVLATHQKHPAVFHLIMNGDDTFKVTTGGTIKHEHLAKLAKEGVEIFITCLEYAKWSIAAQAEVVKNWDKYFEHAMGVCFVDENDKQSAESRSAIVKGYVKSGKVSVVPIPTTIEKFKFEELKPLADREGNFLCFGIIRPFKGIEKFALPLAKTFKEKGANRKVLIVGSIPTDRHPPDLLADMFQQAYGENTSAGEIDRIIAEIMREKISNEGKVQKLMHLYHETLQHREPNVNVEFHFNVEEENLLALFNRCRYGLNFNFKGVSPHFSGVTNTLMAHMKNYGLDLYMTPEYFRNKGALTVLAKAFKVHGDYPEQGVLPQGELSAIADEMLADVELLESDPNWPSEFKAALVQFNRVNPMDLEAVTARFSALYYTQEIKALFPLLQQNFRQDDIEKIVLSVMALEFAFQAFNQCDPSLEKFSSVATKFTECTDLLRLDIEAAIKNMSPLERTSDKTALRATLLDQLVAPYFDVLSSLNNQKKMIQGVLTNRTWLSEIASKTIDHQIGFMKVVLISLGGYDLNLSPDGEGTSNVSSIRMPSLELRLHIYNGPNRKALGEYLHGHGFDLFSKVSPRGIIVDQQFDLREDPVNKDIKRRADKHGVDIPDYDSEADKLEKSIHRLGVEHLHPLQSKHLQARETFRFFGNEKEGYKVVLFSPTTKTYTVSPRRAIVAAGDSLRLHLSDKPHFVISAQGSHTYCMTLRRPGTRKEQVFKPSFLLVDSSDQGLSDLDISGAKIKAPAPAIGVEKLEHELMSFLGTLDSEIAYSNKIKDLPAEKILEYSISNLLNILMQVVDPESKFDMNRIKAVMTVGQEPFLVRNMALKQSLADPEVFMPIFQEELQKKICSLFEKRYLIAFDVTNLEHLELLESTLSLVPYEEDATPKSESDYRCG